MKCFFLLDFSISIIQLLFLWMGGNKKKVGSHHLLCLTLNTILFYLSPLAYRAKNKSVVHGRTAARSSHACLGLFRVQPTLPTQNNYSREVRMSIRYIQTVLSGINEKNGFRIYSAAQEVVHLHKYKTKIVYCFRWLLAPRTAH